MEKVSSTIGGHAKSIVRLKGGHAKSIIRLKVMGKKHYDVIVQSSQDVAPLWHSNANHNSAARVAS